MSRHWWVNSSMVEHQVFRNIPINTLEQMAELGVTTTPSDPMCHWATNRVLAPTAPIQSCMALATNSGPLLDRMCSGTPALNSGLASASE
jgi:hypothetical protein